MKIPPFRLDAVPLNSEAASLERSEWLDPVIGTRHKLGGEPDLDYEQDVPICACGDKMTFYGQLDSMSDEVMIADAGMIYVYLCFGCFSTHSFVQSG